MIVGRGGVQRSFLPPPMPAPAPIPELRAAPRGAFFIARNLDPILQWTRQLTNDGRPIDDWIEEHLLDTRKFRRRLREDPLSIPGYYLPAYLGGIGSGALSASIAAREGVKDLDATRRYIDWLGDEVRRGYRYADRPAPDFVASAGPRSITFPIPAGAKGPVPVDRGVGFKYVHGTGGGQGGLHPDVAAVRFMESTPGSKYIHPDGYVVYMKYIKNSKREKRIHPFTGEKIADSDPYAHIPRLKPKEGD